MEIRTLLLGDNTSCNKAKIALAKSDEIKIVSEVSDDVNILEEITKTIPDVILITDTSSMSLRCCQQIYLLRPKSIPIVICDTQDVNTIQKLMQSGIHYTLSWDMDTMAIIDEIKTIHTNESNRMRVIENTNTAVNKSKVLMVFGTKGGIGTTNVAVNLAVKLAQKNRKVVILDYDLQFGDVSALLGVNKRTTILELIQEQENPNADVIRQFITIHDSGVNVLSSPNSPEYADIITAEQTEKIISALRIHYDYVIVDCGSCFNDITLSCIDITSKILFVTGLEITALKNSKKALDVLDQITRDDKVKLIISKFYKGAISIQDVSRVLQRKVWCAIPEDAKTVIPAVNQGVPFVLYNTKSKVSQSIDFMANDIDQSGEITIQNKKNKLKKKKLFK